MVPIVLMVLTAHTTHIVVMLQMLITTAMVMPRKKMLITNTEVS